MAHAHGKLAAPFADIHVEDGVVRVTMLHDPSVEGVDMALYIDGSASMDEEFEYRTDLPTYDDHDHAPPVATQGAAMIDRTEAPKADPAPAAKKGWLARLFGWFRDDEPHDDDDHDDDDHDAAKGADDHHDDDHASPPAVRREGTGERTNMVEPQVRRMLQYLATKDRNGTLRVAYWACGNKGRDLEVIGEISGRDAATLSVPGPVTSGAGTHLTPALKDFIAYIERQAATGATRGCGIFVTDGQINDMGGLTKYSQEIGARVARGELPPLHLVLVGVGDQVNERQMESISHLEIPGAEHLWCHRVSEEIHNMAELVSGLVDSTMTVASGGAVYDERGALVKRYDKRLPAMLEFSLPKGATSFTLEVEGKRYTQSLPDDDDHH